MTLRVLMSSELEDALEELGWTKQAVDRATDKVTKAKLEKDFRAGALAVLECYRQCRVEDVNSA
jgi:Holliday junction resolvasome RuvABC DNA-binding subunit